MAGKDEDDVVAWPFDRQRRKGGTTGERQRAGRHFLFHSRALRPLPVQGTRAAAHTDGGEVCMRAQMVSCDAIWLSKSVRDEA